MERKAFITPLPKDWGDETELADFIKQLQINNEYQSFRDIAAALGITALHREQINKKKANMNLDFKPIGNLILVSPIQKDNVTKGGIIKVAADVKEPSTGIVEALGHNAESAGVIKKGDTVIYSHGAGTGLVLQVQAFDPQEQKEVLQGREFVLLDSGENGPVLGVIPLRTPQN